MKEFKLKKKDKAKWVAALRSGKYKQGNWHLKQKYVDNDTKESGVLYCCLGVAKEINLCNKRPLYEQVSFSFLPENTQIKLANFNDMNGWSFERIANWIEKYL